MLKKVLLPAAIVAVSQMGMVHQVAAMEKEPAETPESKIDLPEDKSNLSAKEKLFQKYKAMKQMAQQHGLPQDVQGEIGQKQYDLEPIVKFTCPTPKQLNNSMEDNSWEHISDAPNFINLGFGSHDNHLFGQVHSLRDAGIGDENTRQDGKQYRVIYCTYNYVNQYATSPEVNLREDDFVNVHMSIPLDQYSIEFNEENKEFTLSKK